MECQGCKGENVATVSSKCSDRCHWRADGIDVDGYVPEGVGIGGGDYVYFSYCFDCGQMQGEWPIKGNALLEMRAQTIESQIKNLQREVSNSVMLNDEQREEKRQRIEALENEKEQLFL
jgi:hypothetical protein